MINLAWQGGARNGGSKIREKQKEGKGNCGNSRGLLPWEVKDLRPYAGDEST